MTRRRGRRYSFAEEPSELPSKEGPEETQNLRELLLEAAKSDKLSVVALPKSIELGEFGDAAQKLRELTEKDPQHPEYAMLVHLDATGQHVVLSKPIRGESSHVSIPESELREKRVVLRMHTHGDVDNPFSGHDLSTLFLPPSAGGCPAELLVTPTITLLFMRTPATPFLTDLLELMNTIGFLAHDYARGMEVEPATSDVAGEDADLFAPVHPVTEEYKQAYRRLGARRMYVLTRAALDLNLAMYSCPPGRSRMQLSG